MKLAPKIKGLPLCYLNKATQFVKFESLTFAVTRREVGESSCWQEGHPDRTNLLIFKKLVLLPR